VTNVCRSWIKQKTVSNRTPIREEQYYWDALHESIFDAVQPAEEEYARDVPIFVTEEGYIAPAREGHPTSEADAFMTAKLDFQDSKGPLFRVRDAVFGPDAYG
jgi:hypothetical protein